MNVMKTIAGMVALFVTLPIWLYLLYKVLEYVHASELMWFLYWAYIPATILVQVTAKMATDKS
jgi:hypothetical protein